MTRRDTSKIEIIAEIGVNHNGDVDTAKQLITAAIRCGCDAVKFQTWMTERVYQGEEAERMAKLELSRGALLELKNFCDTLGIEFLCTPDEYEDALFLLNIGVKRIKTSSQDIRNLPFLKAVARLGLPMIVSTGAATQEEVVDAVKTIQTLDRAKLTLLHCVSAYPAPLDQMNLKALGFLRDFYVPVGLSDHTQGVIAGVAALALGATIFEKHLTLDHDQDGPDHSASADVVQMAAYVYALRQTEAALGNGKKRVMPCEEQNRERYQKFIAPRIGA